MPSGNWPVLGAFDRYRDRNPNVGIGRWLGRFDSNDLDGSRDAQTVRFGHLGRNDEIDLIERHA